MTKAILYITVNSDGFVAESGRPEDPDYYDFYDSIDALSISNNTYEQILTFSP